MKWLYFFRQVAREFSSISWGDRRETVLMTTVVVIGILFCAGLFLTVDYVVFRFLKFVYGLRF